MTPPILLIATLLTEDGYCGVQTHFNAIAAQARRSGFTVRIVEPHQVSRWIRRFPGLVGRVLRNTFPEYAVLWNRYFSGVFLGMRLLNEMRALRGKQIVIYAQDPLSTLVVLRLRRVGFDFRLVTVSHFNISEAYENQLNGLTREGGRLWNTLMRIERESLPEVDTLIFVSEYMQRVVCARNSALERVEQKVIPNFPSQRFSVEPPRSAWEGDIISIGTMEPRKNQGFLLHVLAEAKRLGCQYRLTLAGDGPSRPEWEALAEKLGISDQVRFLGYVPNASALLKAHRAYVHAARMESFGIVLAEALAAHIPVLAHPVGGISEVFDDGVEGYLWPLDDIAECARLLISVLEDESTWQRMSDAAGQRYRACFTPEVLGPRWLKAITSGLSGEAATPSRPELMLES